MVTGCGGLMAFLQYDSEETLEYYIQDKTMLAEISKGELLARIGTLFLKDLNYGPYEQAMFLSFLLYVTGDHKRMRVVIDRLYGILHKEYLPDSPGAFLESWFAGDVPEGAATGSALLENTILPQLSALKEKVHERALQYVRLMKKNFVAFITAIEEELYLESREIHAEELRDEELESGALRWEYKYLGREQTKIQERWKIYLERQDECPK